ncbi:MAG: DEAD/DEAH box helicase [Spirochaetales bacterium]
MKNFNELGINDNIMRAIDEIGHSKPTLVQEQAIPALKSGDDIVILSQTGSGKTLAFGVPALESVNPELRLPQVLVICPTRELATQVNDEFKKLSKYLIGVKSFAVFGGQPINKQIIGLKAKPNVIVGTPGRILDHIERRTLKLETVSMLILDEADEMLKMGFKEDIDAITSKLAGKKQGVLASATMSKEIKNLALKFLNNPIIIDAGDANSPAKSVEQEYIRVKQTHKKELLTKMLQDLDGTALVFCNTKKMTTTLFEFLETEGFDVKEIHGDMKQSERTRAMNAFKSGKAKILVATDVAARGIDVNNITWVINYDYPEMEEYYIHRIGRTGRAHNTGRAYTFITTSYQMSLLQALSVKQNFVITKSDLSEEEKVAVKAPSKSMRGFGNKNSQSFGHKNSSKRDYKSNKPYGFKNSDKQEQVKREYKYEKPKFEEEYTERPKNNTNRDGYRSQYSKNTKKEYSNNFKEGEKSFKTDKPFKSERPFKTEKTFTSKREDYNFKSDKASYKQKTAKKDGFKKTETSKREGFKPKSTSKKQFKGKYNQPKK